MKEKGMNNTLLLFLVVSTFWSSDLKAYRDCNMECPINFAPAPSSNPLQGYQDRQNCLSRCQQQNSQQSELEKQTDEMEKQTKLLEEQLEAQEELKDENEELRKRLNELEDEQLLE